MALHALFTSARSLVLSHRLENLVGFDLTGHWVVLVTGIVLAQYASNDRMAEAYAMVSLVEQGWADQTEVARAFACSVRTCLLTLLLMALWRIKRPEGLKVTLTYVLADEEVRLLKGQLRLRQVTRLMDNGPQTPILTSRRDLPPAQVAYRMFDRWRQENFFKYLREEYALDALVEYAAVPDDPTREVPNPAWAAVAAQLRQAVTEEPVVKLAPERKHLTHLIKMVA